MVSALILCLDGAEAGIKIAGRNINSLGYAYDITLMAESEEELKSLLMKVKEESESWSVKKAEHRRIDAFELWCWRRLESPLDCKEIQPVHSEGDQPWDFFGRNDAKAETPVLWPHHAKS